MINVVGLVHGTSKKGNPFTVIHGIQEFDNYQKDHGATGQQVVNAYVGGNFDVPIGGKCEFVYAPNFQGQAQVVDVKVIK